MVTIIFWAAWAVFGIVTARWTFTRYLGDEPRRGQYEVRQEYSSRTYMEYTTSPAFDNARWHAFFSAILWPVYLVAMFIGRETKYEKRKRKIRELESFNEQIAQVAKDFELKYEELKH